ncbi:MAG: SurA N-terminal domain-containing protein, partial [Saprospiraceae bacterium]|nr:SurA N-terminal domain-containing protein [Saprospiraceae bacterium]
MALLGKIRKNMWLVIVLVALGLGGFILQDMMSGQQSLFGSQQTFVGKIDGNKVEQREFSNTENLMRNVLYRNSSADGYALKDQLWNYYVEKNLVEEVADDLGLGVCRDELRDLQFGTNLSPIITQRFSNPQTRQIEREQLALIQRQIDDNSMEPGFKEFWRHQEYEIVKQRLQDKYAAMAAKGVYTPSWMAEMMNTDQNTIRDLTYVRVPYADIDNSDVVLSDDDFKAYYEKNKYKYRQDEETRKISYLVFDVVPTRADSTQILERITAKKQPFAETKNDSTFVLANDGMFNPVYLDDKSVTAAIADTIFSLPVGTVYGPYFEGGSYNLVKVVDQQMMYDSADTRHILIGAQTPEQFAAAGRTIDSLKNVILSGKAQFDSLAIQYSTDPGSASKGGLYEGIVPNTFVPEYNEVLFITGEIGPLYTVRTSYGVHLVKIEKRYGDRKRRAKLAFIGAPIEPSAETQKNRQNEVYNFLKDNKTVADLEAAAAANPSLRLEVSAPLKRNDYVVGNLGSGAAARSMVRWAFGDEANLGTPEVGGLSPEFYSFQEPTLLYDEKYVVAGLKSISPKGIPTWQNVKEEIEPLVINAKKAEMIKANLSSNSLEQIASSNNVSVDTAKGVAFSMANVPGMGTEPKVIAAAYGVPVGQVTQPIEGNSGVYVVKVTGETP